MPIPLGYSRHVLSGHLPNGEKFQTGFWVSEAPSDAAATTADAQAVATYLNAHWADVGSPTSHLSAGGQYELVTVYSYPSGGPDASYVGTAALTGGSGTGTQSYPDQCSMCVSLHTGLSGRTHNGRMYIPYLAGGALSAGQIGSSLLNNYATWWKTTFDGINSAVSPGFTVVLSQKLGTAQRVTSLSIDSRMDIQRRRADREVVSYKATATL